MESKREPENVSDDVSVNDVSESNEEIDEDADGDEETLDPDTVNVEAKSESPDPEFCVIGFRIKLRITDLLAKVFYEEKKPKPTIDQASTSVAPDSTLSVENAGAMVSVAAAPSGSAIEVQEPLEAETASEISEIPTAEEENHFLSAPTPPLPASTISAPFRQRKRLAKKSVGKKFDKRRLTKKHFSVEKIMDKRYRCNGVEYLLRWSGFSADMDTWESPDHMNCDELIAEYEQKMREKEREDELDNLAKDSVDEQEPQSESEETEADSVLGRDLSSATPVLEWEPQSVAEEDAAQARAAESDQEEINVTDDL